MTYSPLINETMPPVRQAYGDKWNARPPGAGIVGLIVHHHATTNDSGIDRLVKSADKASANYIIRNNGSLIGSVPEEYRAWTSGSPAADNTRITVEVQDETGAPDWRISDAAMETLVKLYADVAARHGFAPDRSHISGHRDWAATSCPGPYLYPRLDWVAEQASGSVTPVSNPVVPPSTKEYNMDRLDFRNADKTAVTGRHVDNLQGLLLAAGYGPAGLVDARTGRPDGIGGPKTKALLGQAQVKFNTGDGAGHADYICGDATWKALIEY